MTGEAGTNFIKEKQIESANQTHQKKGNKDWR
jgi:hypothetical protein